jgi:hypothetical protein
MKFALRMDYNRYLVMDQATFNKLTEVLNKSEIRISEGYGRGALYVPDREVPSVIMLHEDQLVDELPSVETTE